MNSIGFLHEKSPDLFVCRQAEKVLTRRGWVSKIFHNVKKTNIAFFQAHLLIDGVMVTYGSLIYVLNFGVNNKWSMVLQENMNFLKKILSMSFEV